MTLILNTFMTENFQYNEKTIKIKKDRVHMHSLSLVKVINNYRIIVDQDFYKFEHVLSCWHQQ